LAIFTGGAMNGWFGSTATTSTGTALTSAQAATINSAIAEGSAAIATLTPELQAIAATASASGTTVVGGSTLTGKLAAFGGNTIGSTATAATAVVPGVAPTGFGVVGPAGPSFTADAIAKTTLQKAAAVGGGTAASTIGTTAFQYGLSELQDPPEQKKYGTMAGLMQEEKTLAGTQGIGYTPTQTQFDINAGITPIRPLEYGVGAQPINITQKLGIV